MCHRGEQHLRYNLKRGNKKFGFDILNGISDNVTLVQLMESLRNLNHAISIVSFWIFDLNYEQELHLTRESLNLI